VTRVPSTISAGLPPLFDRVFGTMNVSDFSSTSVAGLRSLTFPALSDTTVASDTDEISLLPYERLPDMHRVSDRAGSVRDLRFTPRTVLPSASLNRVGIPNS
jgi:hypothetical protein